jgi:GTP-binding protein HflX
VVDASEDEDEMLEMLRAVDDVLDEIGAGEQPRLLVLNKADALDEERRLDVGLRHPRAVLVSALTGEGVDELGERIQHEFERSLADIELLIPYSEGARLAELHDLAGDQLEREDTADGVLVRARLPRTIAERYERWSMNGARPA